MDLSALDEHLFVDEDPLICQLLIKEHFERLTTREKLYAHHMAR